MGLTTAHCGLDRPSRWSIAALWLAVAGVVASAWLILGSDGDPGGVIWPLVVAPVIFALVPVVVPRERVRLAAAVATGAWCVLTGFSIGMLLLPALAVQLGAVLQEGQ